MRFQRIALLSGVALFSACESVVEPEIPTFAPDFQLGPIIESVSGQGGFTGVDGKLRTFSFAALRGAGGVTGRFEAFNRNSGNRVVGTVTCFAIAGDHAWIAGVVTTSTGNVDLQGVDLGWRAVDRGNGGVPAPDQLSFAVDATPAVEFCAGMPDLALFALENGNIDVSAGGS